MFTTSYGFKYLGFKFPMNMERIFNKKYQNVRKYGYSTQHFELTLVQKFSNIST